MIVIDYQDRRPLYEQIAERFKTLILQGVLEADSKMPSVRGLAMELSINPNTIQRAYAQLEQQGLIYPVKGRGNFVCPNEELIRQKKLAYREALIKALDLSRRQGLSIEEVEELVRQVYQGREEEGR